MIKEIEMPESSKNNSVLFAESTHATEATTKPKKIAIPPNNGVTFLWIRLPPGESKNFFFCDIPMITGNKIRETTNEVTAAKINAIIKQERPKIAILSVSPLFVF